MNRDLGVWTYEECALVLIDYQNEMFEVIRSETPADLVELNVRLSGWARPVFAGSVSEELLTELKRAEEEEHDETE